MRERIAIVGADDCLHGLGVQNVAPGIADLKTHREAAPKVIEKP